MQILQRSGFGTDIALAKWVVGIAFNRDDLLVLGLNHHATHGFTQGTGAIVRVRARRVGGKFGVMEGRDFVN